MKNYLMIVSFFLLIFSFSCKKAQDTNVNITGNWKLTKQGDDLVDRSMQLLFGSKITFTKNECILRPMDSIEVPVPLIKQNGKYKLDYNGIKYGFKVISKNKIQFNLLTSKGIYER